MRSMSHPVPSLISAPPDASPASEQAALLERDQNCWIRYSWVLIVLACLAATAAGLENRKDDLLGDRECAWPCPTPAPPAGTVVDPPPRGCACCSRAQHEF